MLRALTESGWRIAVLTFEQPRWRLPFEEANGVKRRLEGEGILWSPLTYRKRPRLLSTGLDVASGVLRCLRLVLRHQVRAVHGRGTVPGAIAYLTSRITGVRLFNDADGPLSEEYVDAGVWRAGSIPYRLASWFERRCLLSADVTAVLTERRREAVRSTARASVAVLPCAVDAQHFSPAPEAGRRIREELRLVGRVLVYAGKTGGWYLIEPMIDFAAAVQQVTGDVSLLILTSDEPSLFLKPAADRGVRCVVREVARNQMPLYLSAADAGLSFILSAPSKTACSPIKNGEYLACGLPIVTTPGIGDYSDLVRRDRVGIVVSSLTTKGLRAAAVALEALLGETSTQRRCRAAARSAVGLHEVVLPRYRTLYERLVGQPGTE